MGYRKEDHVQGSFPECGAIFMSNSATRKECFERQLLGLPSGKASFVKQVKAGMALFLFEFEKRELHGVFRACSDGAMNIVPNAFNSSGMQFPAQVRFTQIWHCRLLREHEFRDAIAENYFAKYKFNFGLSGDQVHRLLMLFKSRKLETKVPHQPFIREDTKLIGDDQRLAATNLGTTDSSRFLQSDAAENELNADQRREYDNTMDHSRTYLHKRKRYNDCRFPMHDNINSDVNRGCGRSVINDMCDVFGRSGKEVEGIEYPEDTLSKVRRASQEDICPARDFNGDMYFTEGGCGLAARAGFENAGDKGWRTNDDCRYSVDRRAEIDHYLDHVVGGYIPVDYHGSPSRDVRKTSGCNPFPNDRLEVEQIGENGIRSISSRSYLGNTLENVRKACDDDRFLIRDRVEVAQDQFVDHPDIGWNASGHGKFMGNVYSENDREVDHGFEEDTSTLYAGDPLDEVGRLRPEGVLPSIDRLHGEYNVANSPRSSLPVDYMNSHQPREIPSFCSSNSLSGTDFSFGHHHHQPEPYSRIQSTEPKPFEIFHSTSYDPVSARAGPYEPKILDIHHRRSPHVENSSLLQSVQKISPHHSFIGSPPLSLTKQTSPCHLGAEGSRRNRHLEDGRGSYHPDSLDIHSKHSSYGNNSVFQNYSSHESRLTSLGKQTSPCHLQGEDASRRPILNVTGGLYDSEISDIHGKYSSIVGDNSVLQQMRDFPLNDSSIASHLISHKQSSPYHLQGEDPGRPHSDTFHEFQSRNRLGDYNSSSVRTNNSFLESEFYGKVEPKSSFELSRDLLMSGPSGSMPSSSAGINFQHEASQMSGFKDAAAAECDSYFHRNLSSEHPSKHNRKYNKSSKDSTAGSKRDIDQRSNRTSVFDRLTSGSELRASNDTSVGYDNCDADASVDQIMETLYKSLNHPGIKKAKETSVVSHHKKELPWVSKHVAELREVCSDKPEAMVTEMKNETNQVIVDDDKQIREETRVVEFKRRSEIKKIQHSTDPKSSVQNVAIGANSSVRKQESEDPDGNVVNKRRKLVRPVFGKKEQLNDGLTSISDPNSQIKSLESSKKEIGESGDSVKKREDDNHPPPTLPTSEISSANEKQGCPSREAYSGNAELVGSVSERKESHEGVIVDQTTSPPHMSCVDADSSTKEDNTGIAEKDCFQTTNRQSHVDVDFSTKENNTGSAEKDGSQTTKENNTGSAEEDWFQSTYQKSHVDVDFSTKENNPGSSEKDSTQATNPHHSSNLDADSSTRESNTGSSEKNGFPQSVDVSQIACMSTAGETSRNNADSVDRRNRNTPGGDVIVRDDDGKLALPQDRSKITSM